MSGIGPPSLDTTPWTARLPHTHIYSHPEWTGFNTFSLIFSIDELPSRSVVMSFSGEEVSNDESNSI